TVMPPSPHPPRRRPKPSPTAAPRTPTPAPVAPTVAPAIFAQSAWIVPSGYPAITNVTSTGHNYRGTIEVRRVDAGMVRVINHVDLETYVDGIAEEKGAGWPPEAMKVL